MVGNADKYHLLTSTSKEVGVKVENEIIENSLQEKPLRKVKFSKLIMDCW